MAAPNHSENAVLIATDSVTTSMLSELRTALDELQPLASKITNLKEETLERGGRPESDPGKGHAPGASAE